MADTPTRLWPAIELRVTQALPAAFPPAWNFDERVALVLDGLEATAVEQPADLTYRIYFSDAAARLTASAALAREFGGVCAVTLVDVADEGWLQKVQSTLGAIGVGRFVVAPPWDLPPDTPADEAPILIVIEPSMGFGTGHHESTRLCLLALETLDLRKRRVLDVGTGSGVLAIAAARLGAAHVLAIDVDPDAIASAHDNVLRNGVSGVVEVRRADLATAAADAVDVVLANLTAVMLMGHATVLSGLVVPGGSLVASGFTSDQASTVIGAFPELETADRRSENGWECVVFRRP